MKNDTVLFLPLLFLASCAQKEEHQLASYPAPRVWQMDELYELCSANTPPGVTLPSDLAVSINRTDLEFGRYDGLASFRAHVIKKDGTAIEVGSSIIKKVGQQSVLPTNWSNDGKKLYLQSRWQDPELGMFEESRQNIYIDAEKSRQDVYELNVETSEIKLLTKDSPSFYTGGIINWYADASKVIVSAFIDSENRPYLFDLESETFTPLTTTSGYTYGVDASPDGKKYAFHANYQVYIGDLETGIETRVDVPCSFSFAPQWAPDSSGIIFKCGVDLWYANRNGQAQRFLASSNGYRNEVPFIDGDDFHGGGSDQYVWSGDSKKVIYPSLIGSKIDLMVVDVETGSTQNLTDSEAGAWNAHPNASSDGSFIAYTSKRNGIRNTYVMNLNTLKEIQVTDLKKGCGSYYPNWRPL